MKKLLILSFILFSLNVRAGKWGNIPTSDLDFDFFEIKVEELLNDAITTAIMFDEKIIENKDTVEEMPTARLRLGLDALARGDRKTFGEKYRQFRSDIDVGNQIYRGYNVLMFGPLNELDIAVGNFGDFSSVLSYPVITTAKTKREVMLPKKDGTSAKYDLCLENAEEVKKLVQESVYRVTGRVLTEGIGKVLK